MVLARRGSGYRVESASFTLWNSFCGLKPRDEVETGTKALQKRGRRHPRGKLAQRGCIKIRGPNAYQFSFNIYSAFWLFVFASACRTRGVDIKHEGVSEEQGRRASMVLSRLPIRDHLSRKSDRPKTLHAVPVERCRRAGHGFFSKFDQSRLQEIRGVPE